MSVDVEIYLKTITKFFRDNPQDLVKLIPKEMEEDFYVTLQSDSSLNHFPDNTLTSFRNVYSNPISLSNDYEVALCDVTYVHTETIVCPNSNEPVMVVGTAGDGKDFAQIKNIFVEREIKSISELLSTLSNTSVKFETEVGYVKMTKSKSDDLVTFNPFVTELLGFNNEKQRFTER